MNDLDKLHELFDLLIKAESILAFMKEYDNKAGLVDAVLEAQQGVKDRASHLLRGY